MLPVAVAGQSVDTPMVNAAGADAPAATQPAKDTAVDTTPAIAAAEMTLGPTTVPSGDLILQARAKLDAGDLLTAREQLNDALQGGQLSEADAASVKQQLTQINQTLVFSKQRFPDDPYGGVYVVKPGDSLAKIAADCDTTWELLGRINGIDPRHLARGRRLKLRRGRSSRWWTRANSRWTFILGRCLGKRVRCT